MGACRVLQLFPAARPAGTGHANPAGGSYTTAVTFPWTSTEAYPTTLVTNVASTPAPTPPSNSNPLHGFEAQRFPNLNYPPVTPNSFNPQHAGGVPIDLNANPNLDLPAGHVPHL